MTDAAPGRTLDESEARLRATIEGSLDAVYLLDAVRDEQGTIVDLVFAEVNQRGLDLIEMARHEVVGQRLCELLPINRTGGFLEKYARVAETGEPLEEEFPISTPQHRGRWLHHQVAKVGDGVAITTRDITAYKLDEQERRETADKLAAIVQSSPLAILTLDREGGVTMWNAAAERIFGWTAAEVLGRRLPTVPADASAEFDALRQRALHGHDVTQVETRRLRRDGSLVDVLLSLAPLRDSTGAISGHVTLLADITERRRLEEQLLQAQKMDALGRLAGGVAHDFNNVLTAISGYVDLALGRLGECPPGLRQDVEQIRAATDRAGGLTRELLAFARPHPLGVETVDLRAVVEGLEGFLHRLLGEGVRVTIETGQEPCMVDADPVRLQQVLVNLAVNARDAMPGGGTVAIGVDGVQVTGGDALATRGVEPGRWARLAVADTGSGMDEATLARAFDPFFTTKPEGEGTGLGLSIVYWAVTKAGGCVVPDSAPGSGTTVTVYLPVAGA